MESLPLIGTHFDGENVIDFTKFSVILFCGMYGLHLPYGQANLIRSFTNKVCVCKTNFDLSFSYFGILLGNAMGFNGDSIYGVRDCYF